MNEKEAEDIVLKHARTPEMVVTTDDPAPEQFADPAHPAYPPQGEHLWGPWMQKTNPPKPKRYRMCQHPLCSVSQTEDAPQA